MLQRPEFTANVVLHDVFWDNSPYSPLTFKAGEHAGTRKLEHHLSDHPEGLRSRIVLLDLDYSRHVDQRVLNLLRLTLDVESLCYWSILSARGGWIPRRQDCLNLSYAASRVLKKGSSPSGDYSVSKSCWETL